MAQKPSCACTTQPVSIGNCSISVQQCWSYSSPQDVSKGNIQYSFAAWTAYNNITGSYCCAKNNATDIAAGVQAAVSELKSKGALPNCGVPVTWDGYVPKELSRPQKEFEPFELPLFPEQLDFEDEATMCR
jgi:hypothetical protein